MANDVEREARQIGGYILEGVMGLGALYYSFTGVLQRLRGTSSSSQLRQIQATLATMSERLERNENTVNSLVRKVDELSGEFHGYLEGRRNGNR